MSAKNTEEFEKWFRERFWHECYEDVKHHLFSAWQASRESLVIELPRHTEFSASDSPDYVLERCSDMILYQGLKVAP